MELTKLRQQIVDEHMPLVGELPVTGSDLHQPALGGLLHAFIQGVGRNAGARFKFAPGDGAHQSQPVHQVLQRPVFWQYIALLKQIILCGQVSLWMFYLYRAYYAVLLR